MNSILTLQANHRVLPYSYRYRNPYDWRASASRGSDQWQSQESTYTVGIEPQSRLGMDESPTIGAAISVFSMPKEMIVIMCYHDTESIISAYPMGTNNMTWNPNNKNLGLRNIIFPRHPFRLPGSTVPREVHAAGAVGSQLV